ncbi:MAG: hypothetical protein O2901_09085 [Verrucomicrobia bacterium]|nr:hypothetical protein [Verrucomicrobiota bacterium]
MSGLLDGFRFLHRRALGRMGSLGWNSLLLFFVWRLGDAGNFLYQLILGRELQQLDFGAVQPIFSVIAFLAIPISVVYQLGTKSMSRLLAVGRIEQCAGLTRDLIKLAAVGSILSALSVYLLGDYILLRLHLNGGVYEWILGGMMVMAWWSPLAMAMIRGTGRFWLTAIPCTVGPISMIVLTFLLVVVWKMGLPGALVVRPVSGGLAAALVFLSVRKVFMVARAEYHEERTVMVSALLPMSVYIVSTTLLFHFDPLIVRNFMVAESAGYGAVLTLGRIPLWFVSPLIFVIFPLVAAGHAKGQSVVRFYGQSLTIGLTIAVLASALFFLTGDAIMSAWDPKFAPYGRYLWLYAMAMGLDANVQVIASAEMARHRYSCVLYMAVPAIVMCGLLYALRTSLTLDGLFRTLVATRLIVLAGVFASARRSARP